MKVKINWINFTDYREVFRVTQNAKGEVIETQHIKYVHKTNAINDEHHKTVPLSTTTIDQTIEIS